MSGDIQSFGAKIERIHLLDKEKGEVGVKKASLPGSLGARSENPSIDLLAEKKGCTLGDMAKVCQTGAKSVARVMAGALGFPLQGFAVAVGGISTVGAFFGGALIASPVLAAGGLKIGLKALAGKEVDEDVRALMKISERIAFIPTALLSVPQFLVLNTAGRLGSGLTAFAMRGEKSERKKLEDKLEDQLFISAFEIWDKIQGRNKTD